MRVLVGAETSGIVREAFRAAGHDAYSCDVSPADTSTAFHIQDDLRIVLAGHRPRWDLLIVHLPCTYFCNSGVWAFTKTPPNPSAGVKYGRARFSALAEAGELWRRVADCSIPRIAMENPIPHHYAREFTGPYDQTIQPYQFGDNASKRTCLWLKNLAPLVVPHESEWIAPRIVDGRPRWGNQTDSGQNKLTPSADRWKLRARTYPGIARAMAEQWGKP